MPIDYSKWDDIDSDSDDETPPKPAPAAQKKGTSDATAAAPASSVEFDKKSKQEATGSAWNMNSWHFEETKLDEWGRARLKELLHRAPVSEYIELDGLELDLDAKIVCREVKGDCWVHVRKGKKVWGHDFDCAIDWAGSIRGGSGLQIHGFAEWNWAVDDEEIEIPVHMAQEVPFKRAVCAAVKKVIVSRCETFAKELAAKEPAKREGGEGGGLKEGNVQVGQYKKYEAGPDGVAALQERARQMSLEKGEEGATGKEQKRLHSQVPTH